MKYGLLVLSLLLPASFAYAEIFQCEDEHGKIIYKDVECDKDTSVIRANSTDNASTEKAPPVKKIPQSSLFEDDKPGKVIFSSRKRLSPPYRIKVNEVRLITETDDTLVVDVLYTYEHKIPASEMKIYVTPNHGYWSSNSIQVERGYHVGRATMGLSRNNMKKKRVTRSSTDTIAIRFEHYAPKKYKGVIWSEIVKYKKNWKLK